MAVLKVERRLAGGLRVAVHHGDLTGEVVEAIVNAANQYLAHGGGVAGAIVRRGGEAIQRESDAWVARHGLAGHDRPALTGAGALPCKAVIHAVGPVWQGGADDEDAHLREAYASALELAHAQGFRSVAFPSISTGIFGFPVARGAAIALAAVEDFAKGYVDTPVREVRFTIIDQRTADVFVAELEKRWPDEG